MNFFDKRRSDYLHVEPTDMELSSQEIVPPSVSRDLRPKKFNNRFLDFVRLSSVMNGIAESFFKSEIRRRLFVTAVLIVLSRVGYFVPLPGFDRRLIPQDYLSFVSGSVGRSLT